MAVPRRHLIVMEEWYSQVPEFGKIKILHILFNQLRLTYLYFNYSTPVLSEPPYSQGLVTVGVCSIPAANLRIEQALNLVLSSHIEWGKKIVTELVPPGIDLRLVKNALRRTCRSSVISCQEPHVGIAVPISTRNIYYAKILSQWEWKLWSV